MPSTCRSTSRLEVNMVGSRECGRTQIQTATIMILNHTGIPRRCFFFFTDLSPVILRTSSSQSESSISSSAENRIWPAKEKMRAQQSPFIKVPVMLITFAHLQLSTQVTYSLFSYSVIHFKLLLTEIWLLEKTQHASSRHLEVACGWKY